ncbi:MAG: CPBP family intramembrane metalloprotease [Acidobacteria bacterium]|nr:CPBP family intramembrane metalloprotease [Acidobacteriota bacterium]
MSAMLKGYRKETLQPAYSAALVFPFLLIYHTGTVVLNTTYINGADALLIRLLGALSVRSMFGSALVLAIFFVIWQLRTRASMKIRSKILALSFLESFCFAVILLFLFGLLMPRLGLCMAPLQGGIADLVLYCGAGIYEELVFRAFLLGILIMIFQNLLKLKHNTSAVSAAFLGALLFAAFHYIGPAGDVFSLEGFVQRILGGLYFSVLFVARGFGVTAACHVFYDILVGLIIS